MNKEEEVQKLLAEGMSIQDIVDYYENTHDYEGIAAVSDLNNDNHSARMD